MNDRIDTELMGLLTGELEPERAAALEQRLARDGELARRFAALEAGWRGLELPPPSNVPPGLRTRIVARAREIERERRELDWRRAPIWARAIAVIALAAGIGLGVGVSDFEPVATSAETVEIVQGESVGEWSVSEPGLAELYAEAVEQSTWIDEEESGS